MTQPRQLPQGGSITVPSGLVNCDYSSRWNGAYRWYEKAGLRRDAISSQVIDALSAQEIKETGSEEDYHQNDMSE